MNAQTTQTGGGFAPRICSPNPSRVYFQIQKKRGDQWENGTTCHYPDCDIFRQLRDRAERGELNPHDVSGAWRLLPVDGEGNELPWREAMRLWIEDERVSPRQKIAGFVTQDGREFAVPTTGTGNSALGKPVPFYCGERPALLPEERIFLLRRSLRDGREMLATIERDGGEGSPLHGHYVARVSGLKSKLEKLSHE